MTVKKNAKRGKRRRIRSLLVAQSPGHRRDREEEETRIGETERKTWKGMEKDPAETITDLTVSETRAEKDADRMLRLKKKEKIPNPAAEFNGKPTGGTKGGGLSL